ncbi:hypothetical protein [Geminicoccus roseus]|nr:hypothetical protein [Geminicoccus roseus]
MPGIAWLQTMVAGHDMLARHRLGEHVVVGIGCNTEIRAAVPCGTPRASH